ncbi:hypothetical protein CAPTEDRAFT_208552, partial [Capitella teleta]
MRRFFGILSLACFIGEPSQVVHFEIRNVKQIRRRAERKWRKTHLQFHRDIYLKEKDNVKYLIAEAKTQYLRNLIDGCGGDSKRLFTITSFLLSQQSSTSALPTGNAQTTASAPSEYFIAKIDRIRETTRRNLQQPMPTNILLRYQIDSPLVSLLLVDNESLSKAIAKAKKKYCDLDPVPTKLVNATSGLLLPALDR